jgi:hypothetical protein
MNEMENQMDNRSKTMPGLMVIGLILIGVLGIFTALLSFLNEYNYVGTGLCLLVAAYAFSSVLKAYQ